SGRHAAGNRVPVLSAEGANIREDSVDGITVSDSPIRFPEGEAIVEGVLGMVDELQIPGGSAVKGLVDAEDRRVVADRHEVRDFVADALHVTELESFGSGDDAGFPGVTAIG